MKRRYIWLGVAVALLLEAAYVYSRATSGGSCFPGFPLCGFSFPTVVLAAIMWLGTLAAGMFLDVINTLYSE